jgi:Zn-finger protein
MLAFNMHFNNTVRSGRAASNAVDLVATWREFWEHMRNETCVYAWCPFSPYQNSRFLGPVKRE